MALVGRILRHSVWDGGLIAISVGSVIATVAVAATWGGLSAVAIGAWWVVLVFANCTNFQCVAHNFIHNPFFTSRLANRVFGVVNTLALGVPQHLYRTHHLVHHRFNNDAPDPDTHTTRDPSSTFRYSRVAGREEPLWRYALAGPVRSDIAALFRASGRYRSQIVVETVALAAFVAALAVIDWRATIWFYVPLWYGGQVAAYAENYLEHHGAIPGNRMTDSVSSYGRLYNWLWFNNGYHQEHHVKPQVHWTRVPELRGEMLPDSERRVVRGAHWFNVFPPRRGPR